MMKYTPLIVILYFFIAFQACVPETEIYTNSDAQLSFSVDTLKFDTVFTDIGSATRYIRVYNKQDKPIEIQEIKLAQGTNSKFRLNIDGLPGNTATDVEVPANDSIYIFAEVTIDPNAPLSISPFVIEEKIQFTTNGNAQEVVLEAWGQNANYIPNQFSNGGVAVLSCDGSQVVWDDPKPYVIFGALVIRECDLLIPEGARIYVHGGLESYLDTIDNEVTQKFYNDGRIFTESTGKIVINGTLENPVTIEGDRLEEVYDDVSGQWYGIVIGQGSQGNRFNYVNIKNSVIGAVVDSAGQLTVENTRIYNTSSSGIYSFHGAVRVENSLFYNNGGTAFQAVYGGDYIFRNSTVYSRGEASAYAIGLIDFYCFDHDDDSSTDDVCYTNQLNAQIENSIFIGSNPDEILLGNSGQIPFNYNFKNCIVSVQDLLGENAYPDFFNNCENCIQYASGDALFYDASESDFHLDTLSIAEGQAVFLPELPLDIEGNQRDINTPDIGCYEYQY